MKLKLFENSGDRYFCVNEYFSGDKKTVPLSKYIHLRKISFMNPSLASNNSNGGKGNEEDIPANTTTSSELINYGKLEFSDIIMELNNLTQTFFNLTCEHKT